MAEDDGPLFLSHGEVQGVVVPVIAENGRVVAEVHGRWQSMKASS